MTHQITHFASDVAALRFRIALARLELKYRKDQARVPKTETGAGQFANEGRGRGRARGFVAPVVAAGRVTAASAAAGVTMAEGMAAAIPGAAAVAMGALGISRTAGLATQAAQGGGVTPILGIPYQLSMAGAAATSGVSRPPVSEQVKQQCDAAYNDDLDECYEAFDLPRESFNPGNRNLQQCIENANSRYFECLTKGDPYGSDTRLFKNVNIPRKRK